MLQIEHNIKHTVCVVLPELLALSLWTEKLSSDVSLPKLISYIPSLSRKPVHMHFIKCVYHYGMEK